MDCFNDHEVYNRKEHVLKKSITITEASQNKSHAENKCQFVTLNKEVVRDIQNAHAPYHPTGKYDF